MPLTVHGRILQSLMGRPGLPGTSCFMRRSSISVMKLLCSGYTGSRKDVYSPIPQASADKLLTDYKPLNDVSSHLTCTISQKKKKKEEKARQSYKCRVEGEGWSHRRRIWLKHWNNIDWRSAWLANKYQTGSGWITYCRLPHEAGLEPISDAIQVQVDAHQAQLPSPLDQLVWLHHQPLQHSKWLQPILAGHWGD